LEREVTGDKDRVKRNSFQKALAAYGQAMRSFHKENFQKASEELKLFMENHSSEKELVDRAKIYLDISKSRIKPIKMTLKTLEDYYQFGVYQLNLGEYKEALKALEKAREKEPKDGKILYLMANAYYLMGETDQCLEHLKEAVKLDKFFGILAQNETDFEELKDDKKFNLITRME
jgi:tetratricopeptide (TPR) repeat protein